MYQIQPVSHADQGPTQALKKLHHLPEVCALRLSPPHPDSHRGGGGGVACARARMFKEAEGWRAKGCSRVRKTLRVVGEAAGHFERTK